MGRLWAACGGKAINIQEIKDKYNNFGFKGLYPYEQEQLVLDSVANDWSGQVLLDEDILFGASWGQYEYETEVESIGHKYLEMETIFKRKGDGTYWAIFYSEDQRS